MTNTEKAQKRLAELVEKRDNELTEIESNITKAENELKAAAADMEKAQDKGDPAAYTDAKQRRQAASDALEMFTGRREKISKRGMITGDEYEKITAGIMQDINDKAENARAELYELTAKMDAIAADLDADFSNANHLLRQILVTLYPEGIKRNATGGAIIQPKETPRNAWNVVNWAKTAGQDFVYQQIKTDRENNAHPEPEAAQ